MAVLWKEIFRFLFLMNFVILVVGTLTTLACVPRPLYNEPPGNQGLQIGCNAWLTNQPLLSIASRRIESIIYIQKQKANRPFSTFLLLTILLSGDIQQNPGPNPFPCTSCGKAVTNNDKAIMCDSCENWCHISCDRISETEYRSFQTNSALTWQCLNCRVPLFSDSFFNVSGSSDKGNRSSTSSRDHVVYDRNTSLLRCLTINCRSLKSIDKQNAILELIETHQPDVICATETHLDPTISNSEILPPDFSENVYRKDRNNRGGGVLIATRKNIIASEERSLNTDCEIIWVQIQSENSTPLYISSFYRQPNPDLDVAREFQRSIFQLSNKSTLPNILLTGDFNLPDTSWERGVISPSPQYGNEVNALYLDTVNESNLTQCVNKPTRGTTS